MVNRKEYYQKNKERILAENKRSYLKNRSKRVEAYKKYYQENKDRWREHNRQGNLRKRVMRQEIIKLLGGKCVKCGFDDWRALQVDHINGGGTKERKIVTDVPSLYKAVVSDVESDKKKYQLLCANCNWIKRYENRERWDG